ncbi:class I SAM-dependent methyltransferase [Spongiimicrobium sp. 3-5]|uniref:class I SAM-dependent methyltransferase n=1 Tax=Spongiimicrobium sp. 3-5 TaxID=3332596 RepID=UPI00397EE286
MKGEYYKTKESVAEYAKLAKDVHGGDLIEKLKVFLPAEATILEIGSGPGTDWNILSQTHKTVGSDNSLEFLKYLSAKFPKGSFLELDAVTLKTEKKFYALYSNKVLHHLQDQELAASIQRQHSILEADGIICHSFWRGEGSEVFKGLFVNYHTKAGLRQFFEPYFEVALLENYAEFDEGDSVLLIGRRK